MRFNIHGNSVKVTAPIKDYIEEKIGRLDKYLTNPDDTTANIQVRVRGVEQIIEVTIPTQHIILRGESCDKDLYAAIDLVSEKIESQIRKNKSRLNNHKMKQGLSEFIIDFEVNKDEVIEEVNDSKVVKRKSLELKPMSEEEAILQMNLLGHEFFIFRHENNQNICVLYKRHDGNYGLIITNED